MTELTIFDWLFIVYVVWTGLGFAACLIWAMFLIVKHWKKTSG